MYALTLQHLNGQNFLEGSPEWRYCYHCSSLGGEFVGETSIKYSNEITFNDTTIKVFVVSSEFVNVNNINDIKSGTDTIYLYEENEIIYKWLYPTSNKEMLYNFNSVINDTLFTRNTTCWAPIFFVLDSIGTQEINGYNLQTQVVKAITEDFNLFANSEILIVYKLGAIGKDYLDFKIQYFCGFDVCNNAHKFQSYKNEDLGISYGNMESCHDLTSTNELEANKILVYPNPTTDYIILIGHENLQRVEFYNISGILVEAQSITSTRIDLFLDPGLYIMKIIHNNSEVQTLKLIVNNSG